MLLLLRLLIQEYLTELLTEAVHLLQPNTLELYTSIHSVIHQLEIKGLFSKFNELALWKHSIFPFIWDHYSNQNSATKLHGFTKVSLTNKYVFQILPINSI